MQAPEDEGLGSEGMAGEPPSGGAMERAGRAPLGEDPSLSPRAQGGVQLRARTLHWQAYEDLSSREQSASADGEELDGQAGRDHGDTRDTAVKKLGAHFQSCTSFTSEMKWQGQPYRLGAFPDAVSAAKAYDWAARLVGDRRRLNFGREVDLGMPPGSQGAASLRARVSQLGGTAALERAAAARYLGISNKSCSAINPFGAEIRLGRKRYHFGMFPDARSAARAHDWAARLIGGGRPLNLNPSDNLGAPPTALAVAQLRKDVASAAAQAARSLGPDSASRSAPPTRTLDSAAAPSQQQQPQRTPPRAGAAAKRPARAAPPATAPPAAKQRHAPPEPQPTPPGADAVSPSAVGLLASQLRVLLRLSQVREDDLALDQLSEGALRDITADVRLSWPGRVTTFADLQRRSAADYFNCPLDLSARLAVSVRLSAWQPGSCCC